jgi:DNA segregation ATPase FtsK/SpoIIIE, S-DNA-T family
MRGTTSPALALDQARGFLMAFLMRQLARVSGLGLLGGALFAAGSLATWNIADPSLNHATGNPVTNAMGQGGAILADLLTQVLGVGALPALLPFAALGLTLLLGRPAGALRLRAAYGAGAIMLLCAALACLTRPETWPLPSGLGGLAGDVAMKIPALLIGGYPSGFLGAALALALTLPGLLLMARSMAPLGLAAALGNDAPARNGQRAANRAHVQDETEEDDDDDGAGFALLGELAHHWLSLKARMANLLRMRKQGRISKGGRAHVRAAEPGFDPGLDLRARRSSGGTPSLETPDHDDDGFDDAGFDLDALENEEFARALQGDARPATARGGQPAAAAASSATITPPAGPLKEGARVKREAQGTLLKPDVWEHPPLHLLAQPKSIAQGQRVSKEALEENARILEGVLEDFGVKGDIIHVRPGPVVTLYELEPAPGIKSSRVIGLSDDIARSMSAIACRVAVVPGRNAIGIELPNESRETVYLREILAAKDFETAKARLALALGKTINGEPVIADLAKMPHLLVAGTTGSGKSVAINTMILSLLYRLTPQHCRLIMIDPKMLELSVYDGIPHLLTPVVTDPKKAVVALKWTVKEMEDRYRKMAKVGVRNIDGYNSRVEEAKAKGERFSRTVQTGFDRETGQAVYETEAFDLDQMPFIVVIIDEMADLMMVAGKDIEGAVQRLAQMARAAGIHVVMATQRPSVDVITGTIKANFPTRISFQVTSKIDSRTILGEQGAEQLLGMGDMLFMAGGGRTQRVHGPFVSDSEVESVVRHLKTQGVPQYLEAVTADTGDDDEDGEGGQAGGGDGDYGSSDDPYDQAVAVVLRDRKVSTSYIQRRLGIGYNRAASLIERMEEEGLISAPNHAGKRDILVPAEGETL